MSTISLLIPTLEERVRTLLYPLVMRLQAQALALGREADVQILLLADARKMSIGQKRNDLLASATGEYCAFFDDDDWPAEDYVKMMLEAAASGMDCAALSGVIYSVDSSGSRLQSEPFEHSIRHSKWYKAGGKYLRPPNHLNLVRTSIARQFVFPDKSHGEDSDWSMQLQKAGALQTEFEGTLGRPLYHYAPSATFIRQGAKPRKTKFDAAYIRSIVV